MSKFLSWDFFFVVVILCILLVVHEAGHYLAYRIFGYQAKVRKSLLAPGIDPKETIIIPNWQGIIIAVSGFILSTLLILFFYLINYKYWFLLLIGSIAGSSVDALWACSMLFKKTVTIYTR